MRVYIPKNRFFMAVGYYDRRAIVALLRDYSHIPAAVQFIADMLE